MNWKEERKDEESPTARVILYSVHIWTNEEKKSGLVAIVDRGI